MAKLDMAKLDMMLDACRAAVDGLHDRMDALEKRTDPPVSEAQRRAMHAAASGNSTLGIPKKVGEEFAEADPGGKLPSRKDAAKMGERRRVKAYGIPHSGETGKVVNNPEKAGGMVWLEFSDGSRNKYSESDLA